jgi:hypothetical protein
LLLYNLYLDQPIHFSFRTNSSRPDYQDGKGGNLNNLC